MLEFSGSCIYARCFSYDLSVKKKHMQRELRSVELEFFCLKKDFPVGRKCFLFSIFLKRMFHIFYFFKNYFYFFYSLVPWDEG